MKIEALQATAHQRQKRQDDQRRERRGHQQQARCPVPEPTVCQHTANWLAH